MNHITKSRGFSLLELILVVGIASLAFMGFVQMEQKRQENLSAENSGGQLEEAGKALGQYITFNYSNLQNAITPGTTATLALSAMQSSTGFTSVNGTPVPNRILLPTGYSNNLLFRSVLPVTYSIYIRNTAGTITGLILTNSSVTDKSGAIRYDWGGIAMKKAGSNAGIVFGSASNLSGLGGTWTLTNTEFSQINTLGKLGYRVAYQGNYDSVYLRLDGLYPMIGNLNMGGYNINNAKDITYTGWLYGNNAIFNDITTENITNNKNISTQSINGKTTSLSPTSATAYAGGKSYANFDNFYTNCINCGFPGDSGAVSSQFNAANGDVKIGNSGNAGNLFVKDVVLGGPNKNAFLSQRLNRYADRGMVVAVDGDTLAKPAVTTNPNSYGYVCGWTGEGAAPVPKIEVVPAMQWVQGAVLGNLGLNFNGSYISSPAGLLYLNGTITQDQYSLGAFQTYATDNGASWTIHAATASYDPGGYNKGTALVHVYCDYGN